MTGLRERKKQETRKRISDIATGLFLSRGFDKVTVAEIAEIANVSKMTVFNYFARKEDMLFDREDEALALVERAVIERPAGASPVDALHVWMRRALAEGYPMIAVSPGVRVFWRTVDASPVLRARAREVFDKIEARIAQLLAADAQVAADDPGAALAAAMIWAVQRVTYAVGNAAVARGEPADQVRRRQRDAIARGFAQITAGLAGTPYARTARRR